MAAPGDRCLRLALFSHHMEGEVYTGQQFCWSALLSVLSHHPPPLNASNVHPQTQTHSHRTHSHLYTQTHGHTNTLTHTRTHMCTLEYPRSHTHFCKHTLTHALSLSASHAPPVFSLEVRTGQSAVDAPPQPLFLAAVPSSQSLFHSKQNKMKSNTDLI